MCVDDSSEEVSNLVLYAHLYQGKTSEEGNASAERKMTCFDQSELPTAWGVALAGCRSLFRSACVTADLL